MPSLFDTGRPNSTNSTDAADPSSSAGTPASRQAQPANCRTCTDFKSWAKQQRSGLLNTSSATGERQASTFAASTPPAAPPTTATTATTTAAVPPTAAEPDGTNPRGCPYDKDDLGNATWGLLHTIAAHYPDKPTREEAKDMSTFFTVLSKFYPCETCAKDFREELVVEPINATSQNAFSQWLCRLHNKVNLKLGKPLFDCKDVNQRWRDGWLDGSCD